MTIRKDKGRYCSSFNNFQTLKLSCWCLDVNGIIMICIHCLYIRPFIKILSLKFAKSNVPPKLVLTIILNNQKQIFCGFDVSVLLFHTQALEHATWKEVLSHILLKVIKKIPV